MFIETTQYPENRIFYVKLATKLNDTEESLVKKYGDPEVQVGGTFTDGTFSFTLAEDLKKMKAGFKSFRQGFDGNELGISEAQQRAELYAVVMRERLKAAVDGLKAIPDTFYDHRKDTV